MSKTSRISSSHPVRGLRALTYIHLSEVPDSVKLALSSAEAPFLPEERRFEAAARTLTSLRNENLRKRAVALVLAAKEVGMGTRAAIRLVAVHTGFSESYIRQLFYARKTP